MADFQESTVQESIVQESIVQVGGAPYRVWRKGNGPKLGYLAGFAGLPRWMPFLDKLAETHTVIAPSLPGFPGGGMTHKHMDTHLDWLVTTRDILAASDLIGASLVASSVAGALAADVVALWPGTAWRLGLIAPFGLFDESDPTVDPWARKPPDQAAMMTVNPKTFTDFRAAPGGGEKIEWDIEMARAIEAGARYLWPLGDTKLQRRLPRINIPTLLIWGAEDKVIPRSYADTFASAIQAHTKIEIISGAAHLAELDQPEQTASVISAWMA